MPDPHRRHADQPTRQVPTRPLETRHHELIPHHNIEYHKQSLRPAITPRPRGLPDGYEGCETLSSLGLGHGLIRADVIASPLWASRAGTVLKRR